MFAGADRVSAPRNYPENDHDPDSNPFFYYLSTFLLFNVPDSLYYAFDYRWSSWEDGSSSDANATCCELTRLMENSAAPRHIILSA